MKTLTRDDTEHDVEYVTKTDAMAEIHSWREYATDACCTLRCERDEAARLVRRLLRSHGEKSSHRSVAARADAGLWLAKFDRENAKHIDRHE